MEKNEPSLVPEWLRSKVGGGSRPRFISSLADRRSSSNIQRSSSSNGSSNKNEKNPYARSYSGSTRNQFSKDREKLGVDDSWGFEYSDPLTSLTGRRLEKGSLGRSKSTNSGRAVESQQCRDFSDLRNRGSNIKRNGNGAFSIRRGSSGTHELLETEFPLYGRDERTTSPDIIRAPSPGLNRGVQGLSIGNSSLLASEGWTSALAKVPIGAVGSNLISSADGLQQPSDAADGPSAPASTSTSSAVGSNGSNVTEALVQASVQSVSVPQVQRFEELRFVGNKKLIPMTSSTPQKMVLNPSDKLKPKTAARSNDGVTGLQQISSAQLGSQRGGNILADVTKSSGMLLLKPAREKGGSLALKNIHRAVANGPSVGVPSPISAPLKNANNMKRPNTERKTSTNSLNAIPIVDKRSSLAQLRSRNDFLNLMRKKSSASTTADVDSGTIVTSSMQNSDESKETSCGSVGPTENGEGKCNGDTPNRTKSCSDQGDRGVNPNEVIHTAEELEFLHALGWEDDAGECGDDEGLTEEEINAFVEKYITLKPAAKFFRGLQLKMMPAAESSQEPCTVSASSELGKSNPQI